MMEAEQCDEIVICVTDSEARPDNVVNIWAWPSAYDNKDDTRYAQFIGTVIDRTGIFHYRPPSKVHISLRRSEDGNLADAAFEAIGFNYSAELPTEPFPDSSELDLNDLDTAEPLPDSDSFINPVSGVWQRVEVWKKKYPRNGDI